MMRWLQGLVYRYPVWITAGVGLLTLVLGFFLKDLRIDAEVTGMMPAGEAGVEVLRVVDREFGGSEQAIVVIESESLFSPTVLSGIERLVEQLSAISTVNQVTALNNLQDVRGSGDEVVISRLIDSIPSTRAGLESLRARVLADRRYRGRLVAEDGKAALILVRLRPDADKAQAIRQIETAVKQAQFPGRVSLAGSPALMEFVRRWMVADLLKLIPLVLAVLLLIFGLATRTWSGTMLPLLVVLVAVIWTMGLVGLFRQPVTIVMVVLPPILLAVGSAYGIHILERWQQESRNGLDRLEVVERAVGRTGLPVFLAMVTTAAGFAANLVMKVVTIRVFAQFAVVGIAVSFVLAVVFLPALLMLMPVKPAGVRSENPSRSARWLGRLAQRIIRFRTAVLVVAVVMFVIALLFGSRVRPETDFVRYFKSGSEPARAAEIVNRQFGGELQFEILVEGDIQDPAVLSQMEKFSSDLEQIEHITHISSIVEVLKSTNRAFNQNRQDAEVLPQNRDEVAQYLLLLSFSGSDYLAGLVTPDYRLARITAQFNEHSSAELGRAIREIRALIRRDFGPEVRVRLGGVPLAIYALHEGIATSQLWSIIAALLAVVALVAVMFRSLRLGLAAVLPVGFTLAMAFGLMGLFGIRVDVVSGKRGSIAVGIGIDYSCHLIARYREESGEKDIKSRLSRTVQAVGPPILTNALAVGLGFAVLGGSSLMIVQKFGLLIAGAMLFSGFAALLLVPAVLAGVLKTNQGDKK
ncbi:MAG: MMPL family transporter [candidate division WOR-3 bacterium]